MASHHHHHQHHHNHSYQSACPSSCCTSCCSSCCSSNNQITPPSPTDPLLHAIATQILQSHYLKPQNPIPNHTPPSPTDPLLHAIATQILQSHYLKPQNPLPNHPPKHPQQTQSLLLLQSLFRRVAALEASLRHISTPTSCPSPAPNPSTAFSLRDAAARIIQTRFRIFLARRSQTLRHLKHLASIKSNLAELKSSLSDKNQLWRPRFLLQKAANLLQQLESIQSGDSMIREGKRALSSELVRLVEFLNGMAARRQETTSKSVKKVTILENDNQSRAFSRARELFPDTEHGRNIARIDCQVPHEDEIDEIDLVDELSREIERIEGLSRIVEKDDQGLDVELEEFEQVSDDEREPRKGWKSRGHEHPPGENGNLGLSTDGSCRKTRVDRMQSVNLGLSAPLPVKMEETRGSDLEKKKKVVRVIG